MSKKVPKLKRINFFDRQVVKEEGREIHEGIQQLNVIVACGGKENLWLGDSEGKMHGLDQKFGLRCSLPVFELSLLGLKALDCGGKSLVLALGSDELAKGGNKVKVFGASKDAQATELCEHKIFQRREPEQTLKCLCFDATAPFQLLAVGVSNGVVHLFRARDLAAEKPRPRILEHQGALPVTSVHFLDNRASPEKGSRVTLYVTTEQSVFSWNVTEDSDVRVLHIETGLGAPSLCSTIFNSNNALLLQNDEAIFAFDPDEGNVSSISMKVLCEEGKQMMLTHFRSYFVSVTTEGGGSNVGSVSALPKQTVWVCLAHQHIRFVAYSGEFTDITHVFPGMGSIFVLSRGGADSNTVLFELREKDLGERTDSLVERRFFDWASEIALQEGAPKESVAEVYRLHGDAFYEKRDYHKALEIYMKTVDLDLPIEPSYIIDKYLDAQKIGHIAMYLKKLHECGFAEQEHTALLLKCYTKLRDASNLEEFLEKTPTSQYDTVTAIGVLETSGYEKLAASLAKKVGNNEEYVRLSLEHFKSYTRMVDFIRGLSPLEASALLLEHGRLLMRHAPQETLELVEELCGFSRRADSAPIEAPNVEDFMTIFVHDSKQLEAFLKKSLFAKESRLSRPQQEKLHPTLLELMVRSIKQMREKDPNDPDIAPRSEEVMRLVHMFTGEEALTATLLLCKVYDFTEGYLFACERLSKFQLMVEWCFDRKDSKRLLQVCKRCGSTDQSLWVQALSWLCALEGDHVEEISEVLGHIEQSDLMPPLMVIEALQANPKICVGTVRNYLKGQFKKLTSTVDGSRAKAKQDRQEIERMQNEILSLRTHAQTFQSTKCHDCQLNLEIPAVHFFCCHSYHLYCMPNDGRCPKCSSEALPKVTLKGQREAQARNTEDFFKFMQGGGIDGGFPAIAEWCKFGVVRDVDDDFAGL